MTPQEFQLKKMALLVKGLFATAAIIGMLLFGAAALIHSTTPATAVSPNTTYGTGKYMMQMDSEYADGTMNWYVIVWDTETGRSKFYYGTTKMGKMNASSSGFNLPSDPL